MLCKIIWMSAAAEAQVLGIKGKNPVISADTKKKGVLRAYKNGGKERRKKGESPLAADHDFIPPDKTGKRKPWEYLKPCEKFKSLFKIF
jgi:hypothetical protein